MTVTVMETRAISFKQMKDVCIHSSMVKNRRPGKIGYSRRTMFFCVASKLITCRLDYYSAKPDDAAVSASDADKAYRKSMQIQKAFLKAVTGLTHFEKWTQAIKDL